MGPKEVAAGGVTAGGWGMGDGFGVGSFFALSFGEGLILVAVAVLGSAALLFRVVWYAETK